MTISFPRKRKTLTSLILSFFIFSIGISIGFLQKNIFSENAKFQKFIHQIYEKEVSSSLLTLHYTLAFPEKAGISRPPATLGTIPIDTSDTRELLLSLENTLKSFSSEKLSLEHQITKDSLLLFFQTQRSLAGFPLMEEYLNPTTGIQAQLPILLAEYPFYQPQDVADYLKLLSDLRSYFDQLLAFEQKKSEAGYFMNDTTLDRILSQCQEFIHNPNSNYLLEIFPQKLKKTRFFSTKECTKLTSIHKKVVLSKVIPAYQHLITELSLLRGTGKNALGLSYFPQGTDYYKALLKSQTGSTLSIEEIEKRLTQQLSAECVEIHQILKSHPEYLSKLTDPTLFPAASSKEMLLFLKERCQKEFPSVAATDWEIRTVHPSMEKYLSPAFYLTPPSDTKSPNIIYLNPSQNLLGLELFTTLAHEGFPGHLYQAAYEANQTFSPIRSLLSFPGYAEGWATYIESYAYLYAADFFKDTASPMLMRLAWLNRSVNLCLYSIIDIGIHYRGWNQEATTRFLQTFGIQDATVTREIFLSILEAPTNYLKYYWSYLCFLDLKKQAQQTLGANFSFMEFHQRLLSIGPAPFSVLKKYLMKRLA